MAISIQQAKALVIEFCAQYPVASKISFKIRNTQEEALDEPRATIERAGRIYGAYFPGRGYAAFAVSNFRDEDDFKRTLRHEILGHFGINTFKPEEKRAILDRLIEARNEPVIAQIWVEVDRAYVGMSELRKAEEVFAFACETIEPHLRINASAGVKSFDDTCLSKLRPLTLADLDNITTMVAEGLHDRSRSQQTFPASDSAQFKQDTPMNTSEYPVWLAVQPDDRDKLRAAAGLLSDGRAAVEWNKEEKLWLARPGCDLDRIREWLPDRSVRAGGGDPEAEFFDVLTQAGLIIKGMPVMNGNIQRVATIDDKGGKTSGAYCGYLNRRPAGWFVNYHRAESAKDVTNWTSTGGDPDPVAKLHIRAAARQSQDDVTRERAAVHAAAALSAQRLYDRLPAADPSHPYLVRKGIPPTPELRQTRNGALVVPFFSAQGIFKTLQYIPAAGDKYLFEDAPKKGNFLVVGGALQPGQPILYAEGYATARSLNLATERPVVMTIDAGNMVAVAQILHQQYPASQHVFLADFDHAKAENKGLIMATEAATQVGGQVLYPTFTPDEIAQGFTDFNDLHQSRGLDAVRDQTAPLFTQQAEKPTMPGQPVNELLSDPDSTPAVLPPINADSRPLDKDVDRQQPTEPNQSVAQTHSTARADEAQFQPSQDLLTQQIQTLEAQEAQILGNLKVYYDNYDADGAAIYRADSGLEDLRDTLQGLREQLILENGAASAAPEAQIIAQTPAAVELPKAEAVPADHTAAQSTPSPLAGPSPLTFNYNGQAATLDLQNLRPGKLPEATLILPIERVAPPMPNLTFNGQPARLHPESAGTVSEQTLIATVRSEALQSAESAATEPVSALVQAGETVAVSPVSVLPEPNELAVVSETAAKPQDPAEAAQAPVVETSANSQPADSARDTNGLTVEQVQWARSQLWFDGSGQDDDGAYVFARELRGNRVQWLFRNSEELMTWAEQQRPVKPSVAAIPAARSSASVNPVEPASEGAMDSINVGPRIGEDEPPLQPSSIDKDVLLTRITTEPQNDNSVLYKLDNEPAFVDRGSRLEMVPGAGQSDEKIMAALLTAARFYRGQIELTGSDAFKAKAIELMAVHQVNVSMKNPAQQLMLDQARQALSVPSAKPDAILGDTPPPFGPAPAVPAAPVHQTGATRPKDEPLEPAAPAQAQAVTTNDVATKADEPVEVPDLALPSQSAAPSGPLDDAPPLGESVQVLVSNPALPEVPKANPNEISPAVHQPSKAAEQGVTGKIISCGAAPFRFDEENSESVHIKLRTKNGVQTFWGMELAGLLRESRIEPGRMVTLQWLGDRDVVVKAPVKDPETGAVLRYEDKQTRRNQWSMALLNGPTVRTGYDQGVRFTAYDAARFEMIQHSVIAQLGLQIDLPSRPVDGLFWMTPNGQGSAKAGDHLSAARPTVDVTDAGKPVVSSWSADGHLDMALFRGDGPYLQGVVRQGDSYQHVLVSLPGNAEAPPMVFNAITEQGLVPIGVGNGINRSGGEPVAREHIAFMLEGDSTTRIGKLDFPAELPPALHARLGFDERWKDTNYLPKSAPAAAPKAQPSALRPN